MRRNLPPFSAVRAFEAAGRHLSFKDAAQELHLTQSAISHQVKRLEEFLGLALFRRGAGGVELTDAGAEYLGDMSALLNSLEASTERARGRDLDRPLHIRSTPAFASRWLVPRIDRFNDAYPDVELWLATSIEPVNFATDEVDVLIQYGQEPTPGLRVDPFLYSCRLPVCRPDLVANGSPIRVPDDLWQYTLLRDMVGDGWEEWFELAGARSRRDIGGPRFEHCDLTLRAAEQGQGVALAYEALIADELASGALVPLFELRTPPKVIYSVACPESWCNRPAIAAFRNWLFDETGRKRAALMPA